MEQKQVDVFDFQTGRAERFESTDETMTISFFDLFVSTTAGFQAGFDLSVPASGGWHRHLNYLLEPETAAPGIYLLTLELYSTDPDIGFSEPFWLVFRHDAEQQEHEDAIAWVDAGDGQMPL